MYNTLFTKQMLFFNIFSSSITVEIRFQFSVKDFSQGWISNVVQDGDGSSDQKGNNKMHEIDVMPNDDVTATPKTLVKKSDRARLSMKLISMSLARSDCVMTMTEVCCCLLYSLILTLTAAWRKKLKIFRESDLVKNAIF